MIRGIAICCLLLSCFQAYALDDIVVKANMAVDVEQKRIDGYDDSTDGSVKLLSALQTEQATETYLTIVDRIQQNIINNPNYSVLTQKGRLNDLTRMLQKVDAGNYHLYTTFRPFFNLIIRIQEIPVENRIKAILKSDMRTTLNVIPFFDDKPYALDVLNTAANLYPSEVLKKYADFVYRPYSLDVLETLCKTAPAHVSFYMGGNNAVFLDMRKSKGRPFINQMMDIYESVGSNSKAYILIDDIYENRLTAKQAHWVGRDRDSLFKHLLNLKTTKEKYGSFSIDDELTYMASRKVQNINELHEEEDSIRFALCDTIELSSYEIYALMVYGEDEVYTSTFLGLFERLMSRMTEKTSYEFLHNVGRNKYRTFIKMCAAYNVLPEFLNKMSVWEKRSVFNAFISGLDAELNPLKQAVAVADTYGCLKDDDTKAIFTTAILKEYEKVRWKGTEGEKLYGLLLELMNVNPPSDNLKRDIEALAKMSNDQYLKGNKHVQQHFFFDDADGWSSYATFIDRFKKPGWTIVNKRYYVIIKSTEGKDVELYVNKAHYEYDGQDALKALFKENQRFPDVVVHRGHSYYAGITIESITPNSDLVILGSCGGYNNVKKVLDYAPNAQIISSKQVGTKHVNNELIFQICESIRLGKDVDWSSLWLNVDKTLLKNKLAHERFQDYIAPNENLGAILIRNYRNNL